MKNTQSFAVTPDKFAELTTSNWCVFPPVCCSFCLFHRCSRHFEPPMSILSPESSARTTLRNKNKSTL